MNEQHPVDNQSGIGAYNEKLRPSTIKEVRLSLSHTNGLLQDLGYLAPQSVELPNGEELDQFDQNPKQAEIEKILTLIPNPTNPDRIDGTIVTRDRIDSLFYPSAERVQLEQNQPLLRKQRLNEENAYFNILIQQLGQINLREYVARLDKVATSTSLTTTLIERMNAVAQEFTNKYFLAKEGIKLLSELKDVAEKDGLNQDKIDYCGRTIKNIQENILAARVFIQDSSKMQLLFEKLKRPAEFPTGGTDRLV